MHCPKVTPAPKVPQMANHKRESRTNTRAPSHVHHLDSCDHLFGGLALVLKGPVLRIECVQLLLELAGRLLVLPQLLADVHAQPGGPGSGRVVRLGRLTLAAQETATPNKSTCELAEENFVNLTDRTTFVISL